MLVNIVRCSDDFENNFRFWSPLLCIPTFQPVESWIRLLPIKAQSASHGRQRRAATSPIRQKDRKVEVSTGENAMTYSLKYAGLGAALLHSGSARSDPGHCRVGAHASGGIHHSCRHRRRRRSDGPHHPGHHHQARPDEAADGRDQQVRRRRRRRLPRRQRRRPAIRTRSSSRCRTCSRRRSPPAFRSTGRISLRSRCWRSTNSCSGSMPTSRTRT